MRTRNAVIRGMNRRSIGEGVDLTPAIFTGSTLTVHIPNEEMCEPASHTWSYKNRRCCNIIVHFGPLTSPCLNLIRVNSRDFVAKFEATQDVHA